MGIYFDRYICSRTLGNWYKVRSDSLSVHAEVNHQSEAGDRAQSVLNQIRHTGANGEMLLVNIQ